MSDRELLERAAKAAGHEIAHWDDDGEPWIIGSNPPITPNHQSQLPWNPLTNDGDALRLVVKLGLGVFCFKEEAMVRDTKIEPQREWHGGNDPYAATRRAIVRAAAEIGNGRSQE